MFRFESTLRHVSAVQNNEQLPQKRRVPTQARSRRRVEAILDAAERLVSEVGVEETTTRAIAEAAGIPVASLYQYFGQKEDVLLALAARDMAEMDEQVLTDLAALPLLTVAALVASVMDSFVAVYRRRPAFVQIYLRGRTNASVHEFGREHNRRVAGMLRDFAADAGLTEPDFPLTAALLAVEAGDRVFQLAYADSDVGDADLIAEGRSMVTRYLEPFASEAGRAGIPQ
jgi:AcrR family transcriptional regulator